MSFEVLPSLMGLATISVVVSLAFYLLKRLTPFGKSSKLTQNIVIGIAFGIVAILGTKLGVDVGGATANARDAAPICAGLFFGGPAGIIAGIIGGLWRWFAVAWGAGMYSRLACSISTFLAGVIAAVLRVFMFDHKRPNWVFGFTIGAVIEVMHMTLLFLTHLDDSTQAFEIVKICTIPMVICNGVSVMLSAALISICSTGIHKKEKRYHRISQLVQTPLLIAVIAAFIVSSIMIFSIQTSSAKNEAKQMMSVSLLSIKADILKESDDEILSVAHTVATELEGNPETDLKLLCEANGVSEIYLVNDKGIITDSSNGEHIGYDMNSDADKPEDERQSSQFMCLLEDDCDEFVQECRPTATDNSTLRKYAGVSLKTGGFVQVSYDLDTYRNSLRNHLRILGYNRAIGETGYIAITDDKYNVISADKHYDGKPITDWGITVEEIPEESLYIKHINGHDVFLMTEESEGFHIITVMTSEEVYLLRDNMTYVFAYMQILIFALLFVVIYIIIKKFIVNNIHSVNDSLGKIIGGNLNTTVDVHSSEEFASLSDDINSTVDTLKHYIDEAASRIDKELAFAKSIQHSALPSVFPAYPNQNDFDVFASMDTAKEVGGDFYDFYYVDEDKFAILVADVSGKGIPAAMFMMTAKTTIKSLAESQIPVNEVFTKANEKLCENNDADMFVTAWMAVVDLKTGHVTFANAGHNPPVIIRNGKPEYLVSKAGFVLAGMPGVKYKLQEFNLKTGDRILIYTDGVTEATRSDNELYGEDRLVEFIGNNSSLSAEDMLHSIKTDIDAFVGEAEQFDDITMLMFDYLRDNTLKEKTFDAKVEELDNAMSFITEEMENAEVSMKTSMQISVAFEEMFVNVAHYAYPDKDGDVKIGVSTKNNEVIIQLSDSGIPFNPLEKAEPDTTLSANDRQIGGLGIFMVKKTMDDVNYEYTDGMNIFTMRKHYE